MAKTNPIANFVDWIRDPVTLIIAAPMLDTLKHGADVLRRFFSNDAGDATHFAIWLSSFALCFVLRTSYFVLCTSCFVLRALCFQSGRAKYKVPRTKNKGLRTKFHFFYNTTA